MQPASLSLRNLVRKSILFAFVLWVRPEVAVSAGEGCYILNPEAFAHYVERFNTMEDENRTNVVSNVQSWNWLSTNIPFFACPDPEVEETYYFRWWSVRKHLSKRPSGFVLTEFLTRATPVSSALGHQIAEARWLHDQHYLDDYVLYWLRDPEGCAALHKYSGWLPYALYQRYLVNQDRAFIVSLLDDEVRDYRQWETERLMPGGLFYQYDVRDAMEESISGSRTNKNLRPTINSYMFGNAQAIAAIARLAGRVALASEFDQKAKKLKQLTQDQLWDPQAKFFKVRLDNGSLSDAREEIGFIPWYFELPDPGHEAAWMQLDDPTGFRAPFGITTAERRHPLFRSHGCCHCEWDGAVWPFATSQTLVALGNLLVDYRQSVMTERDYFDAFLTYVRSQRADGKPYIGEYLDETTGQWFNGKDGRSRYYNHSIFADLVITGVVGLRPRANNTVQIHPLLPAGAWKWFCLDGVNYHGRALTVVWDSDGSHYGHGRGLRLLADGKEIASSKKCEALTARLR